MCVRKHLVGAPLTSNVRLQRAHIVDLIIKITFYSSVFLGALLLLVAAGNQIIRKESPISFLFVGFVLLALPLASHIKVGPEGAEVEIRKEIAAVEAKVVAIAEVKDESTANPIANRLLALVMYNDDSPVDKNQVIRTLRNNGFLASPVATDFSEIGTERNKYKPGEAYIKYEKGLENEAQQIKKLLENISGMGSIVTREVKSFKTGDIQIALF